MLEQIDPLPANEIIVALRKAVGPTTTVQFCFLRNSDGLRQAAQLIASSRESHRLFGIVACGCPRQVYQHLIDQAVPAVVFGTPYAGQETLASVDYDHLNGGRLLTEYLIRGKHERIALLAMTDYLPGDNDFLHGVGQAMSRAGRLPDTMQMRIIPHDPAGVAAEVQQLLMQPDRPTGFIARAEQLGRIIIDVASDLGLAVPGDVEVVFDNLRARPDEPVEHTQLRHATGLAEAHDQIATMLDRLGRGLPLETRRVVVPTELCERNST